MSHTIGHGSHHSHAHHHGHTHHATGYSHGKQTDGTASGSSFKHKRHQGGKSGGTRAPTQSDSANSGSDGTSLASDLNEVRQLIASLNAMLQRSGSQGSDSGYSDDVGGPTDAQDNITQFANRHRHRHHHFVNTPSNNSTGVQSQTTGNFVSQGTTVNYNPFTNYRTQCTYGAMNLVLHETGGKAPDVTGNADQWAEQARQEGWTVVNSDPTPGSIAVFQPGSQLADGTYGHVGVVVSVDRQNNKAVIEEMNNPVLGGPGKYNFREVETNVPGTSFIEIPQDEITNPLSATQTVAA